MRNRLPLACVLAGVLSVSCGGSPAGPSATADSALRIVADPVVTLTRGESTALRAERNGQPASSLTWSTSDTSIATVSADGVVTPGEGFGEVIITARAADGATATARGWVQSPAHVPSTYRITLIFGEGVHPAWQTAYQWAAERWQQVIRRSLPPFPLNNQTCVFDNTFPAQSGIETGTRIFVRASPNTNTGTPCTRRPMPRPTSVLGTITASHATTLNLDSPFTNLRGTAMHEIGHALGLVGITYGVDGRVPWVDTDARYTGSFGIEGYRRFFGTAPPFVATRDAHWFFEGELMTSPPSGSITTISVGALMDIGYPAAWYGADR